MLHTPESGILSHTIRYHETQHKKNVLLILLLLFYTGMQVCDCEEDFLHHLLFIIITITINHHNNITINRK